MEKTLLESLLAMNVNERCEKKNGLTYLSWAWAWTEFLKVYPDATYEILKDDTGLPYFGNDAMGYMVYTTVTAGGITREMWLPVMDGANKAMKFLPYQYKTKYGEKTCDAADMFDVNKTIMRCLTKNLAMFGLGLYIYASEDLPESDKKDTGDDTPAEELAEIEATRNRKINKVELATIEAECLRTGIVKKQITKTYNVEAIEDMTFEQFNSAMQLFEKQPTKTTKPLDL